MIKKEKRKRRGIRKRSVCWKVRASLTVEAACLVPLSIIATGVMLSLGIFLYQRAWYTQAACEAVLSGTTQAVLKDRSAMELTSKRWQILQEESAMIPVSINGGVSGNENRVNVKFGGRTPVWGLDDFIIQLDVSGQTIRPVKLLRQTAALREQRKGISSD